MDNTHFENHSFTYENQTYNNLYDYMYGVQLEVGFCYTNKNQVFKFIYAALVRDYRTDNKCLRFDNWDMQWYYNTDYSCEDYIYRVSSFTQMMQLFYLQHMDLFEKMVEDYNAIKPTVHEEMQKVYKIIIDGVYANQTPVIK